jgi:hypothetical protein
VSMTNQHEPGAVGVHVERESAVCRDVFIARDGGLFRAHRYA